MLTPEDKGGFFLRPYLRAKNLNWFSVDASDVKTMWFSRQEMDQYRLQQGDLLVSEGGEVGRTCIWRNELPECYIQNSVNRVRLFHHHNSNYFLYQFYVAGQKGHFNSIVNQVSIAHLTKEKLAEVPLVVPTFDEQCAIVDYLDQQTAVLDTLITKKQQLIELLREERTAVINAAVTGQIDTRTEGLVGYGRYKDSGIEWLGPIPEHWEKMSIKYLLRQMIDTEHKTVPFYEDGTYLVCRTTNIRNGRLVMTDARYTNLEGYTEWTKRGIPEPGDIIFTREAPAGEACIVPNYPTLCLGQRTVLFKVDPELLNPGYGVYSIYGGPASKYISLLSQGSTVAHFNMSDIRNIPMLVPPIDEQAQIVTFLDRKTAQIDQSIAIAERQISLLQEYRTALISAAVIGQIDVR